MLSESGDCAELLGQPEQPPQEVEDEGLAQARQACANHQAAASATTPRLTAVCQDCEFILELPRSTEPEPGDLIGQQGPQVGESRHVDKSEQGPAPVIGLAVDDHER